MNLIIDGEFIAHSGGSLPFKIDCDALSDAELDTLAKQYAKTVHGQVFGEIVGVPRGGLRFAAVLQKYIEVGGSITWRTNLLVD